MGRKQPLTAKQKLLAVITLALLNSPALGWWWYWGVYLGYFSRGVNPPHLVAVAIVNLSVGVTLLALITEKWIRKMR